ncbi:MULTISPECIES: nascent polypeptide-associated complex protein [unclassified Methanobrevibacter]|jgi:nascent polypeptide-associated complex subunit alpha|uniref:nascent polypeptide-associated complex protein n=1 Tax=unclassified Methanobrevibacter TaxID=2638681 RepID=UPI00375B12F9|nr:nascent polypeptide-associated complex protein [Methanobacteriaceae archaeon]
MMPGMNPKQMKKMERQMKKMGMKMDTLEGAREVIIRFDEKELIITDPDITLMNAMGQETYQIIGEAKEVPIDVQLEIPDEDIEMVANTAGVTESDAKQALEDANGDIADAILKLQG